MGNLTFKERLVAFYEKKVYRRIFEYEMNRTSLIVNGCVWCTGSRSSWDTPLVALKASERIKEFSLGRWLFRKYKKIDVKG